MANRKQPDRWESSMLAAVLAVAGTLFLFDKLGSLMHAGLLSFNTVMHSAPLLLAVLGVSLILADQGAGTADMGSGRPTEGHYE
jgi:hypothetical protein